MGVLGREGWGRWSGDKARYSHQPIDLSRANDLVHTVRFWPIGTMVGIGAVVSWTRSGDQSSGTRT